MNAVTRLIALTTSSLSDGSSALATRDWLRAQGIDFDAGAFNRAILAQVRRYHRARARRLAEPWGCWHGDRCAWCV